MGPALGALFHSMVPPKLHQPGLWRGPGNTTTSSPGTGDTFLLSLSGLALMALPSLLALWWLPWDVPPPLADSSPWLCEVPAASPPSAPSLILAGRRRHPGRTDGQVT